MAALRRIEPLNVAEADCGFVDTPMPVFELVDPRDLWVDESYQRGLSERSFSLIRRIVRIFDWRRFKPPVVTRTPEGHLHVIDGQHTAISAASHPKVRLIPVMIVEAADMASRAQAFIGHNKDRVAVTPMQIFHASLAAGDQEAVVVSRTVARAGARILRCPPRNGAYEVGDIVSVRAVQSAVSSLNPAKARVVLETLVKGGCAPLSADAIKACSLVLYDPHYAGETTPEDLARTVERLGPDVDEQARREAKQNKIPAWRALGLIYYRAAASGRRLRAAA
ncbi:DUF6551 family protein [Methylorubrum extorquens]|jgi:hypothetical protein|uniref:ParB domain protein nuclease n=1 Tax=Methylorubrum extorquens DSM 13060 TaxID=882800 RepID=H1KQJ0_METEX|nr:DUF6551 family protein [Methylorubrum extorquens]EHP90210.1 hypothetical protein MetexDRAFT_4903 [Methylorubrum extorquens DSM 13060]